ncbi:MAG: YbjN domain-containing protein [Actinomycetota bacterium]|nr:YbjN domain-containing protein [Actinomycetota bacterium]
MSELQSPSDVADLVTLIDNWLNEFAGAGEHVLAIDRGTSDETSFGEPRWYVRLAGESKEIVTIWLTLGQRTLRYETYVMPAPEDNAAELADQLLRRNDRLVGAHFSVGHEDAIYLRGAIPDSAVTTDELDRVVGTLYQTVEHAFPALIRLGFARRFAD